jgi:hypothetical protein
MTASMQLVSITGIYKEDNSPFTDLGAIGSFDENNKAHKLIDDLVFFWFDDKTELEAYKNSDTSADFIVADYMIL